MDDRLRVCAGVTRAAGPFDHTSEGDDERLGHAAHEDLRLMGLPRVNLLLRGREAALRTVLDSISGNLQEPIATWTPGQPLQLPAVENAGTMILHNVGALGLEDQIHLLEWLGRAVGRTQVVSTTPAPLLPRVRAGAFIDSLYYRLNTVYVDVTP
jgi:Sigma-54 interaction domain